MALFSTRAATWWRSSNPDDRKSALELCQEMQAIVYGEKSW